MRINKLRIYKSFAISNQQISIYSYISITTMPKIKTHKATVKRFKQTRTGKIMKRKAGQGHFNSGESGNTTRKKRRDVPISKTLHKTIKSLTPYN